MTTFVTDTLGLNPSLPLPIMAMVMCEFAIRDDEYEGCNVCREVPLPFLPYIGMSLVVCMEQDPMLIDDVIWDSDRKQLTIWVTANDFKYTRKELADIGWLSAE